jgi:molybdate transport system regulatory protein
MVDPVVRIRVDFGVPCSLGPGKIALLEAIQRSGSLSQAARDLGMSYRRAWQLLSSLNASFREAVVVTAKGGRGGGGARLTGTGEELISLYREFEKGTQAHAMKAFKAIAGRVRGGTSRTSAAPVMRLSERRARASRK